MKTTQIRAHLYDHLLCVRRIQIRAHLHEKSFENLLHNIKTGLFDIYKQRIFVV